jgi:phage baseplate assembly protein W
VETLGIILAVNFRINIIMAEIIGISNTGTTCTSVTLTDIDLALSDLRNHFSITPGEKWTLPDFGSYIPYYLFQPIDDATTSLIQQDVERVVSYDPRWNLLSQELDIVEDAHTITVNVELEYIPLGQTAVLALKFDRESATLVE